MNGELLKRWMNDNHVRAEELAVKLGISFQTVRTMMAGKKPHKHTVTVLSQLMGVRESDLLAEKKDPGPEAA